MKRTPPRGSVAVLTTATTMIAFQVGARATRDAFFLSTYPVTLLPIMMMVTSVLAVAIAYASTRTFSRWGPERVMPVAFSGSAALLLAEWGISIASPRIGAVLFYLHLGCFGALLISGFWSFLNERLDPRTAKRGIGGITAAGTVGGLVGGLAAAQVGRAFGVTAMLPLLAAFHVICALAMARLSQSPEQSRTGTPARGIDMQSTSVREVASTPYIRSLIAVVLFVTISEGLMDLALKGRASATLDGEQALIRFFATFYTGIGLLTVLVQALLSRFALERLGPARSVAVLPASMALAATGAVFIPGLVSTAVARGTESVLSNSVYRVGYEVLFTPVPVQEKRAIKSLVDVGVSRSGDLVAAGIAQGMVLLAMPMQGPTLLIVATLLAMGAFVVAWQLHGGYVQTLARGLKSRALMLDLSGVHDTVTRSTLLQTLGPLASGDSWKADSAEREASAELLRMRDLHSHEPERARRALRAGTVRGYLVDHVVPLLAWDEVARDAITALRRAGIEAAEPLVERLLDPSTEFTIRRRIPLVLGTIADQRVVDGLLRATMDSRFEVRFRSGRALAHLLQLDPTLSIPHADVFAAVLREVETAAGVWRGRDLLDRMDDEGWSPVLDGLVRERANRSLEHVFTLLALVLPREPLRISFRGLHTDDPQLRGTALEYLESTLPPTIRKAIWPYLEDNRPRRQAPTPPSEKALEDLLRSSDSIVIKLKEMKRTEGNREDS